MFSHRGVCLATFCLLCLPATAVVEQGKAALRRADVATATMPSFYHTGEHVRNKIMDLRSTCPGMTVKTQKDPDSEDSDAQLDIIHFKKPGGKETKTRVAFVYGEHARELITVESAFHLILALCHDHTSSLLAGVTSGFQSNVTAALDSAEFLIVPNSNPQSRAKVEKGDFCLRVNEHGVDLNRDWDDHWSKQAAVGDAPPGKKPFGEPETRILHQALVEFKPELFVSIHSGSLGIYTPFAYAKSAPLASRATLSLAEGIDTEFCKCPFGPAASTVGYPCPGTSLDYVYDKLNTKHSFAIEIWKGQADMDAMHEEYQSEDDAFKRSLVQSENLTSSGFGGWAVAVSGLVQKKVVRRRGRKHKQQQPRQQHGRSLVDLQFDPDWCLQNFNPTTHEQYTDTLNRWSHALVSLSLRATAQK